jgi:hypothetical protein
MGRVGFWNKRNCCLKREREREREERGEMVVSNLWLFFLSWSPSIYPIRDVGPEEEEFYAIYHALMW